MAAADLADHARGALLGCALGDAIGEVAFAAPDPSALWATIETSEQLAYTDDTAMSVAVARELVEHAGALDADALGGRFHTAFAAEPWRGYGPGPPKIFQTARHRGRPYAEIAARLHGGQGSLGNGAAMRVAPVGVAARHRADLDELAAISSRPTHAHAIGREAALLQARTVAAGVAAALAGEPLDGHGIARELVAAAATDALHRKMGIVAAAVSDETPPGHVAHLIGRSVAAHESVPFAIYAFLRTPGDFRTVLETAILNGGDRDTLGAMACAATGAYVGERALPEAWLAKLEDRDALAALGTALADTFPGPAHAS